MIVFSGGLTRNGWMAALFAALLTLPITGRAAQPAAGTEPRAVLAEDEYDFGKAVEGTLIRHEFPLKNPGKSPLRIIKIEAG